MSLEAMIWALKKAPAQSGQEQVVLIALADHASSEGTGAYPSQKTISEYAQCSDRTVRRHLEAMENRGLIRRGEQGLTAHLSMRRKPVVWDLDMSQMRTESKPDNMTGSAKADICDAKSGQIEQQKRTSVTVKADTAMSDEPSVNRPEPSVEPYTRGTTYPEAFEAWWRIYPKKVGKGDALKAWTKVTKNVDPETLESALEDHLPSMRSKETRFVPNPATWLNQGRYDDDVPVPDTPPSQPATKADRFKQMAQAKAMELTQGSEVSGGKQLGAGYGPGGPVQSIGAPSRQYPEFAG